MGYTCIDNDMILNPDISHGAFRCYVVLRYHARQAEYAFPSEETLAKELGVTPRTVRNYLKELESHNLIRREKNVYFFEESGVKNSSENGKIISKSRKNISENLGKNFPIEEKESEEEKKQQPRTHAHTRERPNHFVLFEQNINQLTPFYADQLIDLANDYSEVWLELAIKTAAFRNIRKLSYIAGILKGWREKGFNPPPEISPPPVSVSPSRIPDPNCPKCGGEGYVLREICDETGFTIAADYPPCDCWHTVLQAAAAD